jgi:hypothetical protein
VPAKDRVMAFQVLWEKHFIKKLFFTTIEQN